MNRNSTVQNIVDSIRSDIRQNYRPGSLLPNERQIAERFGVGRNTVREALIHLEAFGLIEKTQRGPRVCAPNVAAVFHVMDQYFDRSLKTCQDLLDFRRMIDIGVLQGVVENITDADIAALEEQVRRMGDALTAHEAALADYAFHSEIIRISGNGVLAKLYKVLEHTLVFYMEIGKSGNGARTSAQHGAILEALRQRSLRAAQQAFDEHYGYSEANLLSAYRKDQGQDATTEAI